ncbi:MAG: DUF58 domain-containing protein [Microbacteriaceae bacterium]
MKADTESRLSRTAASTRTHTRAAETVTRYTRTRLGVVGNTVFWGRRLARSLGRVATGVGGWLRETVLPAGWLALAAVVVGVTLGLTVGWVEAWVVATIAAVLLIFSVPFLLGGHDYRVHLSLDRDRVVAGSEVTGNLVIVNQSSRISLPGLIDVPVGEGLVEAHIPLLLGGAEHRHELTIAAHRRGVIAVGPMTIGRGDPVGILRRELSWPQVQQIYVHPVTVAIPATSAGLIKDLEGSPTRDIVDSDLSFHAIRHYAAGDSRRHIHWKSTAKTGELMVRQYEETRRASIAIVLDLNSEEYATDEEFETTVSAAASLAVQGVRDGREVIVSGSAEIPELSRTAVQSIRTLPTLSARVLLDAMAEVNGSERAMRLNSVTALTVQSFPEMSIAFLVTGSVMTLARLRAAAVALPQNVTAVAVRVEPGAEPTLRTVGELSVMTIGALHDLKHLIARGAIR